MKIALDIARQVNSTEFVDGFIIVSKEDERGRWESYFLVHLNHKK